MHWHFLHPALTLWHTFSSTSTTPIGDECGTFHLLIRVYYVYRGKHTYSHWYLPCTYYFIFICSDRPTLTRGRVAKRFAVVDQHLKGLGLASWVWTLSANGDFWRAKVKSYWTASYTITFTRFLRKLTLDKISLYTIMHGHRFYVPKDNNPSSSDSTNTQIPLLLRHTYSAHFVN